MKGERNIEVVFHLVALIAHETLLKAGLSKWPLCVQQINAPDI